MGIPAKSFLPFACALGLAAPADAESTEGCADPAALGRHAAIVSRTLEGLRSRPTATLAPFVPPGFAVRSYDWSQAEPEPTSRPLDPAYFRRLLSTGSFTVRTLETMPGLMCGRVVVKWWRPREKEAYWMNSFEFRDGRLAEAFETDLVALAKRGPPKVVAVPRSP
jgi:hypothetical protein